MQNPSNSPKKRGRPSKSEQSSLNLEALGEGSTGQTELSRTRLGELLSLAPNTKVQKAFGVLVSPLYQRIAANERESTHLASIRDALLPRLLSGEIPIKNAERFIASQR